MKAEVQRTWFQCRSHDKVKGLIRGTKGLEVNKPSDIFLNKLLCRRIREKC
jgi:hypothetical protein